MSFAASVEIIVEVRPAGRPSSKSVFAGPAFGRPAKVLLSHAYRPSIICSVPKVFWPCGHAVEAGRGWDRAHGPADRQGSGDAAQHVASDSLHEIAFFFRTTTFKWHMEQGNMLNLNLIGI
jgi:hypothetical protein